MKRKRGILLILVSFTLFFGCAASGGYERVHPVGPEDRVTISDLEKSWRDYHIYYAGQSLGNPLAVLFDPRNDEMTLVADYWTKMEDEKSLKEAISWIDGRRSQLLPSLRKIIGSDNRIFGYVYTGINHVVVKSLDEKKLEVYRIQDPSISERGGGK